MGNLQEQDKAKQDTQDNSLLKAMPAYDADTWPSEGVNRNTVVYSESAPKENKQQSYPSAN